MDESRNDEWRLESVECRGLLIVSTGTENNIE